MRDGSELKPCNVNRKKKCSLLRCAVKAFSYVESCAKSDGIVFSSVDGEWARKQKNEATKQGRGEERDECDLWGIRSGPVRLTTTRSY